MKTVRVLGCAATLAAAGPVCGQVFTWTGAAGPNWFTAGSWSPAAVPPIGADVVIPGSLPARVQLDGGAGQVVDLASIDAQFPVDVRREASIGGGVMRSPMFDIADPARELSVGGLLRLTGVDGIWRAGTLSGGGELRNQGTWVVGGGAERRIAGCTVRNAGTMRFLIAPSRVDLFRGAELVNDGLLVIDGFHAVADGLGPMGGGTLVNTGTVSMAGAGEATIGSGIVNTGRVEVTGGGSRLRFNGRAQDHRAGLVSLAGGGTVTVMQAPGGPRPRLGGRVEGTGDFIIGVGAHAVEEVLEAELGAGSLWGLVIDAGTTTSVVELLADIENLGKATWKSGSVAGPGVVRNRPGAVMTVATGIAPSLKGGLANEGTLVLQSELRGDGGQIVNAAAGTISVRAGGGFVGLLPGAGIVNHGLLVKEGPGSSTLNGGTLDNHGTLRVAQGALNLSMTIAQVQAGELTGGIWISEPGAFLSLSPGITKIGTGATVEALGNTSLLSGLRENRGRLIGNVSGTLTGPLLNAGQGRITLRPGVTMSVGLTLQNGEAADGSALIEMLPAPGSQVPPKLQLTTLDNHGRLSPGGTGAAGAFTMTGALIMRPAGRVLAEIGGTGPGQSDEMVVSGSATLGGTLALSLINGFVPAAGQEFVVLRVTGTSSLSGAFASVEQPAGMPQGLSFSLVYGPSAVTARVGPACYANCDGSTIPPVLNVTDFVCFQTRFAAGDPRANCDGSTQPPVLNVADFICFQSAFAAGCS